MNYLIHAYLTPVNSPKILVGNMIGDYVKGNIDKLSFDDDIKKGLYLHRKIDLFAEHNRFVLQSMHRFSKDFRRYGRIMIDIFYDHFLAVNWRDYSDMLLVDFAQNVYIDIEENYDLLPVKFQELFYWMKNMDWLANYKDLEVIEMVLERMSNRLSRKNILDQSISELEKNYQELEQDFKLFFDEIKHTAGN